MGDVVFFDKYGDEKMVSILEVAKYFLSRESMTHLKLQKMCYYAQAWHLAIYGERLFDEKFQAWLHGPVSPSLYQHYKQWGWYEIAEYVGAVNLCEKAIKFLELVFNVYGSFTGNQLENFTHSEKPWLEARNGTVGYCTNVISDKTMQEYYRDILDKQIKETEVSEG